MDSSNRGLWWSFADMRSTMPGAALVPAEGSPLSGTYCTHCLLEPQFLSRSSSSSSLLACPLLPTCTTNIAAKLSGQRIEPGRDRHVRLASIGSSTTALPLASSVQAPLRFGSFRVSRRDFCFLGQWISCHRGASPAPPAVAESEDFEDDISDFSADATGEVSRRAI